MNQLKQFNQFKIVFKQINPNFTTSIILLGLIVYLWLVLLQNMIQLLALLMLLVPVSQSKPAATTPPAPLLNEVQEIRKIFSRMVEEMVGVIAPSQSYFLSLP